MLSAFYKIFSCMLRIPLFLLDANESVKHDPIHDKFEMILQDIMVYYSKKLDLLRIKSEQHQVNVVTTNVISKFSVIMLQKHI